MDHPIISTIMPVYNVAEYLRESLDSALSQTFSDFELICVDDGSTDSSGAILDEYAARDARIRVVHQKNAGAAGARNTGLDLARGEIVTFLDADDLLAPELYETIYPVYRESGAEIARFSYSKMLGGGRLCKEEVPTAPHIALSLQERIRLIGNLVWDKFFSKDLIEKHKIRFHDIAGEDTFFAFECALRANKIVMLPEPLYFYRERVDSLSHLDDDEYLLCNISLVGMVQNYPTTEEAKKIYEEWMLQVIISQWRERSRRWKARAKHMIRQDFPSEVWRKLREWEYELPVWYRYFFLSMHGSLGSRWRMYFKYLLARYLKAL
ncbi:MAG: glycosyltransferase [Planctomycetia bacterium]|nr:glycosyltransferase [Planctomycetia bacterium]